MKTTVVNLVLDAMLPQELRDPSRSLDKDGVDSLMLSLAKDHPALYPKVAQFLSVSGANLAFKRGETFGIEDFKAPASRALALAQLREEQDRLDNTVMSAEDKADARGALYAKYSDRIANETSKESVAARNNIAMTVMSGARGKKPQLRDLISTPGYYLDHDKKAIPWFIERSFAEGLSVADFLAGTYAARESVTECLEEGTEVRMADGSIKCIQDIRAGDMVVGVDTRGCTIPTLVKSLFSKGEQQVWEFQLRFSNSNISSLNLRATANHKVLMTDPSRYSKDRSRFDRGKGDRPNPEDLHTKRVQEAGMLGVGRRAAVLPAGGEWEASKQEPYGFLLGLLAGDGCLTRKRVTFSCADPLLIEHVKPRLEALGVGIRKNSADPCHHDWSVYSLNYLPTTVKVLAVKGAQGFCKGRRTELNKVLDSYDMSGKYSWQKSLPSDIWQWRDADVVDFIACYFACDGCISTGYHKSARRDFAEVIFSSTSENLLLGIKDLLLARFGISSGKPGKTLQGGFSKSAISSRVRPCYSLKILRTGCIKRFAAVFGPSVPGVKRERLSLAAEIIRFKDGNNNPFPKASLAKKTLVGMRPCWDIEVDHPDHLFLLANGLIVSNSKKAVAKGGFLSKTLARTNYRNYVTVNDCGTTNGIDLPADEKDLRGRVLQQPVGEVGQGSVISRGVFNSIKKAGKPVLVRSALTCEAPDGVCAKCYGVTAEGRFPSVGEHVGITASNALGEPLAQGGLSMKHVTSASGPKKDFSGLDYLFQFTESPEEFKDKAPVSPLEGSITGIREAAQGGSYVSINGANEVYIPLERTLSVKIGDSVEAGDALSDGLVDPEDILKHKGLGEGRRYYADKLNDIATASGAGMDRRHFEVLARKAIDHVELDDPEEEGFLPSDLVSYESFMHKRKLPDDLQQTKPSDSVGKYLQQPSLHYSVGTKITPRVAKRLTDQGIGSIATSTSEPGFKPVMLRLQQAASFDDDWLARMGGSYLTRNLEDSKTRALDTNIESNAHPVPRLAVGVGYGDRLDKGKGF